MSIAENLARIKHSLPPQVRLVAVSKKRSINEIMEAYAAGQRDFGENRPQELQQKYSQLPHDIRWHFIGHLQSNKVKMVAPIAHLIHSIDTPKLLCELNKFCAAHACVARVLLQVHVAIEETKFGFSPDELIDFLHTNKLVECSNVVLCGLMCMASNTPDEAQVRREFQQLQTLYTQALALVRQPEQFTQLSMGMSGDYPIAVSEGATLVRIGTAIFHV